MGGDRQKLNDKSAEQEGSSVERSEPNSVLLQEYLQSTGPASPPDATIQQPDAASITQWASSITDAHQKLDQLASGHFKGKDLNHFRSDMQALEQRASAQHLSDIEVEKTYQQIDRLLESNNDQPIKQDLKDRLAQQILHHAAHPTAIDQGSHKTCAVTTIEARTYTRTPSAAARLVAEIGLSGRFITADGTTVAFDQHSLQPDWEAQSRYPQDGQRSYASQIFQVAAVNVHWLRQSFDNHGNPVTPGDLHYKQDSFSPISLKNGDDSGERPQQAGAL